MSLSPQAEEALNAEAWAEVKRRRAAKRSIANRSYLKWAAKLRLKQRPPEGDWFIWLIRSGRGFGKTLAGSVETCVRSETCPQIAIVAATFGDGRDYCVEGETGIRSVCPDLEWNRSIGEGRFPSGARFKLFSGEEPERLRGPNNYWAWCDEYASWRYRVDTFKMLLLTLRKGSSQILITTTPKPWALKDIEERASTVTVYGSTRENIENLSETYIREVVTPMEGTALGLQEIEGLDIEETPGALWKHKDLEAGRVSAAPDLDRIVVGVDPSATSDGDEAGIVAAGRKGDVAYVLEDRSVQGSPKTWAQEVVSLYYKLGADRIVAEKNNGGEMVELTIHTVDPNVPVTLVWASRGKTTRAEPIAALYEPKPDRPTRVHHVGAFPELEQEMCTWVQGMPSPNRMDAAVWALTDLMLGATFSAEFVSNRPRAEGVPEREFAAAELEIYRQFMRDEDD